MLNPAEKHGIVSDPLTQEEMEQLFTLTARSRGFPIWARYGTTTALVLAALVTRWLVFGPGTGLPFLLFFPAVILSAVAFDRGTGVYASLLSSVLAVWFFFEPAGSLKIVEATDLLALLIYLGTSMLCAFLLEALHIALARSVRQGTALAAANAELRNVAEEKGMLLSEAVHRARNDLQRLSATLSLQARAAGEPAAKQALSEAADRIAALARINERLDRHKDDGYPEVDSRGFVEGLAEDLRSVAVGLRPVVLLVAAEPHMMTMARAVPVGLVLNELVANALKYAFPEDEAGQIRIGFHRDGESFVLTVEDNGIGFDPAARPQGSGLGARLGRAFAGQLGGNLDVAPVQPGHSRPGARWTMWFPVNTPG